MKQKPRRDDAAAARLRANGDPEELDRILQTECRRRAAKKLPATLLCQYFRFPTALSAEQCTSDALADIHAAMIPERARVVDLTCGLAIDAFHIARRAAAVTAVDIEPDVAAAVTHNAAALGLTNVTAVCADCRNWLQSATERFDVAFIDPARRGDRGQRLFSLADCRPDVVEMLPLIARVAPRLIVKMSPMLDIAQVLQQLPETACLHVLGTDRECKELVADVRFGFSGEPEITVHPHCLAFRPSQRREPKIFQGELQPGMIIGEPYPAVMKADPRGLLPGEQLHLNTHLWVNVPADFPGRRYVITSIEPFSSSNVRRLARQKPAASVAVRNFPLTADALRARLHAGESADVRLMGTTTVTSRVLLFLRPL